MDGVKALNDEVQNVDIVFTSSFMLQQTMSTIVFIFSSADKHS